MTDKQATFAKNAHEAFASPKRFDTTTFSGAFNVFADQTQMPAAPQGRSTVFASPPTNNKTNLVEPKLSLIQPNNEDNLNNFTQNVPQNEPTQQN